MPYQKSTIRPVGRQLRRAADRVSTRLFPLVRKFADEQRTAFQDKIRAQDFVAFHEIPLSPKYLEKKKRKGLDLRTMIATGHYVKSIVVMKRIIGGSGGGGVEYAIGFRPGDVAVNDEGEPVQDMPLWRLALIQEHGSRLANIPARPHWQPHLREMQRAFPAVYGKIRKAIVRDLTRKV